MSFFSKLFRVDKNPNSYKFKLERAKELHTQAIRYVTENRNGNDDVIGRGGSLCLKDDVFIVDSSGERIFMCNVKELEASYLMSGDGVVLKGPDLLNGNKQRTVTAHFVYYRK